MGGFTLGRKESSMKATYSPASYRVVQLLLLGIMLTGGCSQEPGPLEPEKEVPRAEKWGIYILERLKK